MITSLLHLSRCPSISSFVGEVLVLLLLLSSGNALGQKFGEVNARADGKAIVISVANMVDVDLQDLFFFYSRDAGETWAEINPDCLQFEGSSARWDVLNCLGVDEFEGSDVQFKVTLRDCRSVAFDGYRYEVVQIGSQCWFAENLRTVRYTNGDEIAGGLSSELWGATTDGAQAVYDDSDIKLEKFGRFYNGYAVNDARGLCPIGWHVPTDGDWMLLEHELGMSDEGLNRFGFRGSDEGAQLKSSPSDTPAWNGSNDFGFAGFPSGARENYGDYGYFGYYGYWWTSSSSSAFAICRILHSRTTNIVRDRYNRGWGFSVRCVRD